MFKRKGGGVKGLLNNVKKNCTFLSCRLPQLSAYNLNSFSAKSHLVYKSCSSTQIMQEIALFSRKIYTAGTNFTRPPVVTVATNLNSGGGQGSYLSGRPKFSSMWYLGF